MKKHIFIKSFLLTLISVLFVFIAGIGITYINNKKIISERLITETQLAASLLDSKDDFSTLDVFKNQEACRITIISLSGDVLYDSDAAGGLENHLDREEVKAALSGNEKAVERYSETFECKMTYYATLTSLSDQEDVILRVAVWSAEINDYILSTLPFLGLVLLLSALIAGIWAKRLSESIAGRITDIAVSLKSVNEGDYIPLSPGDADIEFASVYNEINELNSKTAAHLQSEESERKKLNAVLDNVSQGIIALTARREVLFANGSALRLLEADDAVISKPLELLVRDKALLELILAPCEETYHRFEYTLGNKSLLVEVIRPEEASVKEQAFDIVILSDRSVEKELSRQKEEFFANASHELKTPLTAMLGLSELALAKSKDETVRKNLERIHKETRRLSELISDMLKLSLLETVGETELRVSVPVREIAQEVVNDLSEAMRSKGVTAEIHGEIPIMADEKKIYTLLQNLCSNAVNYNRDNGHIEITLEENATVSVIRVRDTGIGISEENIPYLFERFYRVDKSRSKKTGGTGLGLAIVKHICARYRAEIKIHSEVDVGTEIEIHFPKT